MKHKHAEMIYAKAANMAQVVFYRDTCDDKFHIKPSKEKRWIGVWREFVTPRSFDSRDSAEFWVTHNSGANQDYWQFIEIEIEIEI